MRDEEGGGDVKILSHEDSKMVREFAEDIAFAVMPKDRDSLIALFKRVDAQTECISGLNVLVETKQRQIDRMKEAMDAMRAERDALYVTARRLVSNARDLNGQWMVYRWDMEQLEKALAPGDAECGIHLGEGKGG